MKNAPIKEPIGGGAPPFQVATDPETCTVILASVTVKSNGPTTKSTGEYWQSSAAKTAAEHVSPE